MLKVSNLSHQNTLPPCGRLKIGENPIDGVKREVFEETGLKIIPLIPVDVWIGMHNQERLISITYVCVTRSIEIFLSDEHSNFLWICIEDLKKSQMETDFNTENWPGFIKFAKAYGLEKGLICE